MTPYDEFLRWCSEAQSGGIGRLRDAARRAAQSARDRRPDMALIEDLQALGHIEVDWSSRRWQVAPPTLCRLEDSGGLWLLTGNRPECLYTVVDSLEDSQNPLFRQVWSDLYLHDEVAQAGPGSIYVTVRETDSMRAALASIGIRVVDDPSSAILRLLQPTIAVTGQVRTVRPGELQGRLLLTSASPGGWEPSVLDERPGVYRYLRNGQRVFAERRALDWLEMDRRSAIWCGAGDSGPPLLTRSPGERLLFARDISRLPELVERALVLRTGRLPTRLDDHGVTGQRGPVWKFENVSGQVASSVAAVMERECEIV